MNFNKFIVLQLTNNHSNDFSTFGSFEEWQLLSKLCRGNTRLQLAVSLAFTPPLLEHLGVESGGIHLLGNSSTGKSSAGKVAASVWGSLEYTKTWRATANGLESQALSHNDTLLCLDEIGQLDPYQAGEVAYLLANGQGKIRANAHGGSRKSSNWRLLFLSTGEISLKDLMLQAGKKLRAGQEVRVIDVPADTGKYGVFENLHGYADGAKFADALGKMASKSYGYASKKIYQAIH
jgi:putative DNA primase/helicase